MLLPSRHSPAATGRSPDDPPERIRAYVESLARRERRVWIARVAVRLGWVALAVGLLGLVAPHARMERSVAVFAAVCTAGLLGWWAAALPWIRGWKPLSDPLRQARLVERQLPALRGRLVTATDGVFHPERAAGGSPALAALLAEDAWAASRAASPAKVHPGRRILRGAMLLGTAWIALLLATALSSMGPAGVVGWWLHALAADAAVVQQLEEALVAQARVGDLHLRYTYPGYTGLDPKEVENSTGDATGPPGTIVEVVARSGEPVEAAGLEAYGETFDVELGPDGRTLSGDFQIRSEPGVWTLSTWRGETARKTREFTITPEPDLPPEVVVDVDGDRLEVALDQHIAFPWRARDDYGVRSVGVEIDGKPAGTPLFRADGRKAEAFDRLRVRPGDLGLKAGQTAKLVVAAWDNDSISGSKAGRSRTIEIVVLGAAGRAQLAEQRREELVRLMLPVLARFLVEPWPAGDSGDAVSRWGRDVSDRYTPLSEAVARIWTANSPPGADRALVERVLSTGRELIRYTQVAFTPGATDRAPADALTTTTALRVSAIVALEDALSSLDALAQMKALSQVVSQARRLEKAAVAIEERLADAPPATPELLSSLDSLTRSLDELGEASRSLSEGGIKDLLDARDDEIRRLMEEVRRAATEGRPDDARSLMQRTSRQVQEMARGVEAELDAARSRADESMQEAEDLLAKMKELEDRQRALQAEVKQLRDRQEKQSGAQTGPIWEQLDQKAGQLVTAADALQAGLTTAGRPFYEIERARAAVEDSRGLQQAIAARDLRGADSKSGRAYQSWNGSLFTSQREARKPGARGPGPADAARGLAIVEDIEALLEQLHQAAGAVDPGVARQAQDLEQQQKDLGNELDSISSKARELGRTFPVRPDGLEPALDEAGERMDAAGEDLGAGQPMPAEGSQGVAAERIGAARDALERAMQQAAQQQREGSQGGESGEGEGEGADGEQEQQEPQQVEIPTAEEFQTPEEYRRALLQGMEGDVPEEYRALKKRYYEELVAQ